MLISFQDHSDLPKYSILCNPVFVKAHILLSSLSVHAGDDIFYSSPCPARFL